MRLPNYTGLPSNNINCFVFQGSPDITFNSSLVVVDDQDDQESRGESLSGSDAKAVIENPIQMPL